MAETTYRASCHCGKFVYEATLPNPLTTVAVCNCSICTRKGYVLTFENKDKPIRIVKGSLDDLTVYHRRSDFIHWFCPDCSAPVLIRNVSPTSQFALNVRCFQGPIDVWDLEANASMHFDGASIGAPYKETPFTGPEPTGGPVPGEPAKTYYGSCQCGAVRLALRCKPLDTLDAAKHPLDVVKECNCSICKRIACRWFYSAKDQVSIEDPDHQMAYYRFGTHVCQKGFCRQCGVTLTNGTLQLSEEELAALPPAARSEAAVKKRAQIARRMPVNLRVLYGVDQTKLTVEHADGTDMLPPYVNP